jgi:hypothetical protein
MSRPDQRPALAEVHDWWSYTSTPHTSSRRDTQLIWPRENRALERRGSRKQKLLTSVTNNATQADVCRLGSQRLHRTVHWTSGLLTEVHYNLHFYHKVNASGNTISLHYLRNRTELPVIGVGNGALRMLNAAVLPRRRHGTTRTSPVSATLRLKAHQGNWQQQLAANFCQHELNTWN